MIWLECETKLRKTNVRILEKRRHKEIETELLSVTKTDKTKC